jgi:hypothetical protein
VRKTILSVGLLLSLVVTGCSHVSTVRLQPDAIAVGPGLRPIAGIQANATSLYALFIPIPGVDLDKVINRMLIVTAKTIGADKIANLQFDIDPDGGIWALRKLAFYRSARASGIAVQVTGSAPDPKADQGPEPAMAPSVSPAPTAVTPGSSF